MSLSIKAPAVLSIDELLTKQNRALLRDFSESGLCLVAASPKKLADMQRFWGWTIERLPRCLPTSVIVVRKDQNADPECWARWDYKGYRKAFATFLQVHHPDYGLVLNRSVHVDHLEPRYRFSPGDEYFIRLHLVSRKVNSSFGAGFERNFCKAERGKALHGAIHMSWMAYCKAYGAIPPGKAAGVSAWKSWAREQAKRFAGESGESAASAYAGLLGVLQLGYTGYYSGEAKPYDYEKVLRSFSEEA